MKPCRTVCAVLVPLFAIGTAEGAELAGKAVYDKWCADCHRAEQVGAVQLQRRYNGTLPAVLTERRDIRPELVKVFVRNGGQVMPIFRKTEISDAELEALADYLSAANRGN